MGRTVTSPRSYLRIVLDVPDHFGFVDVNGAEMDDVTRPEVV